MRRTLFIVLSLAACATDPAPPSNAAAQGDAGPRDFGIPDAGLSGFIYAFDRAYRDDAGAITHSYTVTAGFAEAPSEACADLTPLFVDTACTLLECFPNTAPPIDGGTRPTAGNITIDGGHEQVYLFPQQGQYLPWNYFNSYFEGGERLVAVATGAEIPAFSLEVFAPTQPILSSPTVPANSDPLELRRDAPLQLAWSQAATGTIRFTASVVAPDRRRTLECRFPADANAATVPSVLLDGLPPGDAVYEIRAENSAETIAGEHLVRFTAAANAVDASMFWARGRAIVR